MNTFPVPLTGTENTLMWAKESDIEPAALEQLHHVADLSWTHGLRVMPDVHFGRGATIGSVIAMEQAIAPAAVGVDIGCGMTAVRTNLTVSQLPDDLAAIRHGIEAAVPVGFAGHPGEPPVISKDPDLATRYRRIMDDFQHLAVMDLAPSARPQAAAEKAMQQVGTLGGGNHFIELCRGDDGFMWVTLHSGSRGTGNQMAQVHIKRAQALPENQDVPDRNLSVFLRGTSEMDDYLHDLWWAQAYALLNRDVILRAVCDVLIQRIPGIAFGQSIKCHHNYVALENYGGQELIITRKGAIKAGVGDMGVIPGSMGTGSYIVRGLGNDASYQSASHGAGRRMSRTQAKKQFTAADLSQQTAGIECRKDVGVVDEIPAAYKDIDQVIADQQDLVDVVTRLHTVLCVKG